MSYPFHMMTTMIVLQEQQRRSSRLQQDSAHRYQEEQRRKRNKAKAVVKEPEPLYSLCACASDMSVTFAVQPLACVYVPAVLAYEPDEDGYTYLCVLREGYDYNRGDVPWKGVPIIKGGK